MFSKPGWEDRVYNPSLVNARRPSQTRTYFSSFDKWVEPALWATRAGTSGRSSSRSSLRAAPGRPSSSSSGDVCPCCGRGRGPKRDSKDPVDSEGLVFEDLTTPSTGCGTDASAWQEDDAASISNAELTSSLIRPGTEPDTVRAHRRILIERERRTQDKRRSSALSATRRNLSLDFERAAAAEGAYLQRLQRAKLLREKAPPSSLFFSPKPRRRGSRAAPAVQHFAIGSDNEDLVEKTTPPLQAASETAPPEARADVASPVCPAAGKGKGKGKPPPPPPPSSSRPSSRATTSTIGIRNPFSRRLDWRPILGEKLRGTIFEAFRPRDEDAESDASSDADPVDLECLQEHFGHRPQESAQSGLRFGADQQLPEAVELLGRNRAQNMLIALKRHPLTAEVLHALESLDLNCPVLCGTALEVLQPAMPTEEESKLLLAYTGDPLALRSLELRLLPLARLRQPSAAQRLRLVRLSRNMEETLVDIRSGLHIVGAACEAVCESLALKAVLRHVLCLGNTLNHGSSGVGGDVRAVQGFGLDVLPRL
ncbi:unnamed protein product, partial [Polarella glacialis]